MGFFYEPENHLLGSLWSNHGNITNMFPAKILLLSRVPTGWRCDSDSLWWWRRDGGIAGGFTIIRNEIDCFDYQYFPLPSSNFTHTSTFPTEQNRTNTVNISNRDGKLLVVVLSRQSDLSIYLLGGCRWSLNKQFSLQLGNRLLCWLYRRRHSIHAVNGCRKEVNAFDL